MVYADHRGREARSLGKKFNKLDRKIDRAYEARGFSKEEAAHIAAATAGKVYREKLAKAAAIARHRQRAKKRGKRR